MLRFKKIHVHLEHVNEIWWAGIFAIDSAMNLQATAVKEKAEFPETGFYSPNEHPKLADAPVSEAGLLLSVWQFYLLFTSYTEYIMQL